MCRNVLRMQEYDAVVGLSGSLTTQCHIPEDLILSYIIARNRKSLKKMCCLWRNSAYMILLSLFYQKLYTVRWQYVDNVKVVSVVDKEIPECALVGKMSNKPPVKVFQLC
jgi:hypothetical protein